MEKIKVLLVDDEKDNLELLYRTLRHDYLVEKTTSPLEALEMLDTKYFDIILSDHKMPEMDGVEFLKRSCELSPQSVRLLVTAYSDANILIDAINEGKIFRYLKKPWEPAELIMVMQTAVDFSKLKQENDRLIYDLKKLFSGTVNAIIEALDAKDSFTLGRSRRVTMLSMLVAKKMNFPPEEIGKLELAGLLHDIGMIGVSEEILNKIEALTPYEYEMIKKHVEYGVRILEDIKQLKEVIEIIKTHHEKYDGSGYPLGIKGDEIPISARIIAVADAYDSMVSQRSYRQGLSHDEAIKRIELEKGRQFDPDVADVFLEVIPEAIKYLDEAND
ncbi:MAG TPA: HD domain-containing phosphohydrolase [Candidatus Gastranaerophilaceae bacterium]|nr:HD domain-containing phosphohydrolase [Candidatus Gastranaerophilaceae bacterium]HPT41755.1 HD domain-containing phosphohydrolase [Candidatus Gastranaerophilaceae bacterium]